jgi:hypothetical protein
MLNPQHAQSLTFRLTAWLDDAAMRRENLINSHFEKIFLREWLSSYEKSWQNATHTVPENEPEAHNFNC